METNESILTREIVSIDDRKRLGKLKDLCVDYDTRAISYYIVNSTTTNSSLVLPFDKSLAVGDTFMTIQSRADFLPPSEEEAKNTLSQGFRLVGSEVYSRTGNKLGVVESYEFDPTYGLVTKIILGKRSSFSAESFVFFSPEFVFVDDGEATDQEKRSGVKARGKKKSAAKAPVRSPRKPAVKTAPQVEEAVEEVEEEPVVAAVVEEVEAPEELVVEEVIEVEEPEVVEVVDEVEETAADDSDEDAVLKDFLLDAVVSDDVVSKDGEFKVSKGTKLTKELIDEAQAHDALLLLTMSVEA